MIKAVLIVFSLGIAGAYGAWLFNSEEPVTEAPIKEVSVEYGQYVQSEIYYIRYYLDERLKIKEKLDLTGHTKYPKLSDNKYYSLDMAKGAYQQMFEYADSVGTRR